MARKRDHRGRSNTQQFTKLERRLLQEEAWRCLSSSAKALYPYIRLEWKGPQYNNNGRIRLSLRQAAKALGVTKDTAARAFQDLQAKGFIAVTKPAILGVDGGGTAHEYEITELAMPKAESRDGSRLFRQWKPGQDFPVIKAAMGNPTGANGKKRKPVITIKTIRS
jgi:DNA-binding transcriptional MocR family regulator